MKLFILLSLFSSFTAFAQEPSLEDTKEYINIKLSGTRFWYNPHSTVSTIGCEQQLKNYFDNISKVEIDHSLMQVFGECGGERVIINISLALIRSVSLGDNNTVVLASSRPFIHPWYGDKSIVPENETKLKIHHADEPEKLLRAFKHFCKLQHIDLVDDKF